MKDRRFLFNCGEGGRDRDVGTVTEDKIML